MSIELLISENEIRSKIAEAARQIDAEYRGEELTIIMVMKGAICLVADLIRALKTPLTIESIKASSYGQLGTLRGGLTFAGLGDVDLSLKNILLIDDIYDSGETLTQIMAHLKEKKPKTLKTLVLLSKKVKRKSSYVPDYVLFEIENLFVVGYGLDYKEHYRGLPGIYVMGETR